MVIDPEISAMERVLQLFQPLRQDQRKRIHDWLNSRFNLTGAVAKGETVEEEAKQEPAAVETDVPEATDSQKQDEGSVSQPSTVEPVEEEPPVAVSRDLKAYDSLDDLFKVTELKRVGHRILLAAAYLQEKKNFTELTSLEINNALKQIDLGVPNITLAINRLVDKVPQVMVVTRKEGSTKQSRRNFQVTEEGVRQAMDFIKLT